MDETRGHLRTPLLIVAVRERTLSPAGLGMRLAGGTRALHVLVVKAPAPLRIRRLAFQSPSHGLQGLVPEKVIESYLTRRVTVELAEDPGTIAIDGELLRVTSPLRYELALDAVTVVHGSSAR